MLQDLKNLLFSLWLGQVRGVAFLPQEFSSSQERLRVLELPSDDGIPLVEFEGKVSVTADPFGVVWVHDSF